MSALSRALRLFWTQQNRRNRIGDNCYGNSGFSRSSVDDWFRVRVSLAVGPDFSVLKRCGYAKESRRPPKMATQKKNLFRVVVPA